MLKKSSYLRTPLLLAGTVCMCLGIALLAGVAPAAADDRRPSLVITDDPLPEVVYRPSMNDEASGVAMMPSRSGKNRSDTLVSRKIAELEGDLSRINDNISSHDSRLASLKRSSDAMTAEYYALVAGINADLQSGTTPGNPDLVEDMNAAQEKLGVLADGAKDFDRLSADLSSEATRASYLLDATQATFGLSGAVKADHQKLTGLEDRVNQAVTQIARMINMTQDEINRRNNYLRAERLNLQTLSLAVARGEFYGQSISNRLFRRVAEGDANAVAGLAPEAGSQQPRPVASGSRRPLVVIRFERPDVEYEQAVYAAINKALEKHPRAGFELVSVSPSAGNAAEVSLAGIGARKHGEDVLRTLTQMGLPTERIRLSEAKSASVKSGEVHIFIE